MRFFHIALDFGGFLASTTDITFAAAEMVLLKYKDFMQPILKTEDAIRAKSFFDTRGINFKKGNVKRSFGVADIIVEGKITNPPLMVVFASPKSEHHWHFANMS